MAVDTTLKALLVLAAVLAPAIARGQAAGESARPEGAPPAEDLYMPHPSDIVIVEGWPSVGKWMIDRGMQPASWLGARVGGKPVREPINVVLVDARATSAPEATARLVEACRAAGFKSREGHSGGYRGYLGGVLFHQLPETEGHAFSDEPFEMRNNHGRVFGPLALKEGWMFIAAFSRERFEPLARPEHMYVSFNEAREAFARRLEAATDYAVAARVSLGNALGGDAEFTTGDHDGVAVVLRAQR